MRIHSARRRHSKSSMSVRRRLRGPGTQGGAAPGATKSTASIAVPRPSPKAPRHGGPIPLAAAALAALAALAQVAGRAASSPDGAASALWSPDVWARWPGPRGIKAASKAGLGVEPPDNCSQSIGNQKTKIKKPYEFHLKSIRNPTSDATHLRCFDYFSFQAGRLSRRWPRARRWRLRQGLAGPWLGRQPCRLQLGARGALKRFESTESTQGGFGGANPFGGAQAPGAFESVCL